MAFWSRLTGNSDNANAPNEASGLSDDQLVARLHSDRTALATLYQRYLEPVYRYCYTRLGNRERAEDATSETFVKLLASLDSYRGGNFGAWLFRIAHNVVIDSYRTAHPAADISEFTLLADPQPTPEQTVVGEVAHADLYEALAMLNDEQRAVVALQAVGWSDMQIGASLGRSVAAVRMTRLRAMQRLRDILTPATPSQKEASDARL